ncbi:MAG: ATPase [Bryobacterales bacterium]|nr:ATPase [Bryobacterales bacterium]MDE0260992.1 ATPase [Bryobacterales bacterium]MDE0620153.1 ATPase [Bryobacterales bacterium]
MAAGRLFLGVDGGQSSTKAVIGDAAGNVLGRGRAGPCNHASKSEGRSKLRIAVSAVIEDALEMAGLPVATGFEAACLGMSGGPADKRDLIAEIVRADAIRVFDDAEVALEGAVPDGAGAVVIAGTGSIGLAKDTAGTTVRCGGWGYLFGDEGGAFSIVRKAVQLALAAEEGWGDGTSLVDLFLGVTGTDSVNKAMHCFYRPDWPRDRIARLAPDIDAAAEAGDRCAAEVLQAAGRALGDLAVTVTGMLELPRAQIPVHYSGGVFRSRSALRSFRSRCEEHHCRVETPAHDGAIGALLLAYGMAGVSVLGRDLK